MEPILLCPNCKNSLTQKDNVYQCIENHSFDISKEGYLNLLLVNQKSTNFPGDDLTMVTARRKFLDQGFYQCLVEQINLITKNNLKNKSEGDQIILDCGCGEGYYTNKLFQYLKELNKPSTVFGLDLSKDAIRIAAKKYRDITFIISNLNYELPFKDSSVDLIINIFAPKNPNEFSRILVKGGIVIVAFPNNVHLKSLKEKLGSLTQYGDKPQEVIGNFSKDFKLIDTKQVETNINLSPENAEELVKMTPIYWQIDHKKLTTLKQMTTEIGFNIYIFKKVR